MRTICMGSSLRGGRGAGRRGRGDGVNPGFSSVCPCWPGARELWSRPRSTDIYMSESLPCQLVHQVAGSFELTALLQKRVRELVRGQKALYETRERNYIKIASEEVRRGLIQLVPDEEQEEPAYVL